MLTRAHPASTASLLALLMGVVAVLGGCSDDWSQATPEATITTARKLVEKNRTREMYKLVYAESPEMTGFLQKLGVLFSNMQKLAAQIEQSMPDEVAKLKAKTQEAVESGKAADVLGQIAGQRGSRRRGQPDFRVQERMQDALDGMLTKLFTNPYEILRDAESRLTTAYLTDDTVSLRWDDEPILPPIGLQMKQDEKDGLWYFRLPLNIPSVGQYLPKSAKEWKVAEYGVVVLNNTLVDLRIDIREKRITTLDGLIASAKEKTIPPIVVIFAAYSKAIEDRKKATPPAPAPTAAPATSPT